MDPLHRGKKAEHEKKAHELAKKAMLQPKKHGSIAEKYPMAHFKKKKMSGI